MGIPSPLAFPPTAIRNVAAGLVVGNSIGSGGTRGKALTAAELKAIVEASGISFLPLSGGTLTGDVTAGSNSLTAAKLKLGATSSAAMFKQGTSTEAGNVPGVVVKDATDAGYMSLHARRLTVSDGLLGCWNGADWNGWVIYQNLLVGTNAGRIAWSDGSSSLAGTEDLILRRAAAAVLAQRNGLNAQCVLLNKTYTSDASQEALMLDAGKQISGKLGLYSYRGTSGGSNNPIQIGMLAADGTTFSGLAIDTTGAITASSTVQSSASAAPWYMGRFRGSNGGGIGLDGGGNPTILTANSNQTMGITGAAVKMFSSFVFGWINATNVGQQLIDQTLNAALGFGGSGIVEINNGITGTLRDLSCRAITTSGQITQVPLASVTLATNGQFSIEMTSNTAGNLVYRGSDGTTRRMALLFA